jgi:hypothetical protein
VQEDIQEPAQIGRGWFNLSKKDEYLRFMGITQKWASVKCHDKNDVKCKNKIKGPQNWSRELTSIMGWTKTEKNKDKNSHYSQKGKSVVAGELAGWVPHPDGYHEGCKCKEIFSDLGKGQRMYLRTQLPQLQTRMHPDPEGGGGLKIVSTILW